MGRMIVAPARERGLKFDSQRAVFSANPRSREGAWIEIAALKRWAIKNLLAPARERGLKLFLQAVTNHLTCSRSREGAWIEISGILSASVKTYDSLPRGSVD